MSLRISTVVAGVETGRLQPLVELVRPFEVHADAPAAGDVPEGGGHEGLAHADRSEDEGVAGLFDETHRDELGPHRVVVGDLGALVPGFEHHVRVEAGRPGPSPGRVGVTSGDLVAEQLLQELGVTEVVALGQRQALGQGVEQLAELQLAHEGLEFGRHGRGQVCSSPGLLGAGELRRITGEAALNDDRVGPHVGLG